MKQWEMFISRETGSISWRKPICTFPLDKILLSQKQAGGDTKVFFSSDQEFPRWYKLYKNTSNENASSVILCHDL